MNILSEIIYEHVCPACSFTGSKYRQRVERDGDVVFHVNPRCVQTDIELRVVEKVYIDLPDLDG